MTMLWHPFGPFKCLSLYSEDHCTNCSFPNPTRDLKLHRDERLGGTHYHVHCANCGNAYAVDPESLRRSAVKHAPLCDWQPTRNTLAWYRHQWYTYGCVAEALGQTLFSPDRETWHVLQPVDDHTVNPVLAEVAIPGIMKRLAANDALLAWARQGELTPDIEAKLTSDTGGGISIQRT